MSGDINQYGDGSIGEATHSGSGDIVAGGKQSWSPPPSPSRASGPESPPPTPSRAGGRRRPLIAAVCAVLSAVVGALVNLLTSSWSWWIFAAAALVLFIWAAIAYLGEAAPRGRDRGRR
ncbi:hypothetical protein [Nonomuraea insulae]|uniref:Phage holin family protein n=1 Tax=Nonomuraea insulae TaxID=1616787 RepID=A0ABW1CMA7_9ACTN